MNLLTRVGVATRRALPTDISFPTASYCVRLGIMETPSESSTLATWNGKDPAFISATAFHEACYSLVERSQVVDLPGWRLKISEEV